MHIILEPDLFLERFDKMLSLWKHLKGKSLLISADKWGRVLFKCDPHALDMPAKIVEAGQVMVEAQSAHKALQLYSRIDDIDIFTKDDVLIIKQRNFTMTLPCFNDKYPVVFEDALSTDRLIMLKLEKKRLQGEIRRIDQEVLSVRSSLRIRRMPR